MAQQQTTQKVADKVEMAESKSLGKWLTVGGDYQFRVDSLRGETRTFTDVNATFANAESQLQAAFFSNPVVVGPQVAAFNAFAQGMMGVKTYSDALAFSPQVLAMMPALAAYSQTIPAYKPKNDTMYTNRFGLDLNAKAAQDVSVGARLMMYKTAGDQSADALTNSGNAPFFADRVGVFDGTLGHVPSDSYLNVDRAYATWNNLFDEDLWFSVGRRPSTHGAPTNFKYNGERPGRGGTPALLVDYAFDGMTLGYGADIDSLPGAYAKVCYGRGFESGFRSPLTNSIQDTDMLGVALVPIDTDKLRVWLQWNRGINIFDAPKMSNTYFGNTMPKTNLGDIDWYGLGLMGTIKNVGKGDLNYFADFGWSVTHPNQNVSAQFGFQGLLTGGFFNPEAPSSKTGTGVLLGVRYDLPSKTKLGFEYNYGSKNWITFAPAANDMWTSKFGTRGNVYEAYLIQELDAKPISSHMAKTFFRLGFQYYDFKYTGSNNWVGAPVKISDVNGQMMTTTPLEKAYDAYATVEVKF
ncbi:MAG: DUF3373 domain-containing protein [Rhodocyclaceae bacterium]|nr:DUF3373 domain-containing protein [Rhodocyclaceae bacterium]